MQRREAEPFTFPAFLAVFAVILIFGLFGADASGQEKSGLEGRISDSEEQLGDQGTDLRRQIDEISSSQRELEDAQAVVDLGERRVGELNKRRSDLSRRLELATERRKAARVRYEETVEAAYRGSGVRGVELFLNAVLGGGDVRIDPALSQAIVSDKQSLDEYQEAETYLKTSQRQLEETNAAYNEAIGERSRSADVLRGRIQRMQESASSIRAQIQSTREDITRLEAEERRRISRERSATVSAPNGSEGVPKSAVDEYAALSQYESEVLEDDMYYDEVSPISDERYIQLYQEAAKQYGFPDDWYILAAIGKIESGHGQNLGPSSAGAMGPMQFLPSTWVSSGVDGNGDGDANIMDPEDAIPAAAGYLKSGGAPGDWYAAIYSYNHADWYVQEVLSVSEGYRRLAEQEGRPTL